MTERFVDVDGRRTRYFEAGAGPTLLLVHGIGMTADTWVRNVDVLARDHRVVAPDLLGCGFTEGMTSAGEPPLEDMIAHLRAFAARVGVDRCVVLGSSLGGWIATLWYLREPARFTSLVLVCCEAVVGGTAEQIGATAARSVENGRRAFDDASVEGTRARIQRLVVDPRVVPESVVEAQHAASVLPHAQEAFERRTAGLVGLPDDSPLLVRDRLRDVAVPVLAIWGERDPRGSAELRDWVTAELHRRPDELVATTFADTGHLAQLERPDDFNATVGAFLAHAR